MINITLLGATGSIGKSTLSVVDLHPDMFNSSNEIKPLNVEKIDKSC